VMEKNRGGRTAGEATMSRLIRGNSPAPHQAGSLLDIQEFGALEQFSTFSPNSVFVQGLQVWILKHDVKPVLDGFVFGMDPKLHVVRYRTAKSMQSAMRVHCDPGRGPCPPGPCDW
jgi:hypothetical protein